LPLTVTAPRSMSFWTWLREMPLSLPWTYLSSRSDESRLMVQVMRSAPASSSSSTDSAKYRRARANDSADSGWLGSDMAGLRCVAEWRGRWLAELVAAGRRRVGRVEVGRVDEVGDDRLAAGRVVRGGAGVVGRAGV